MVDTMSNNGRVGFHVTIFGILALAVVVQARRTPNRPTDGFVNSGYFWPKTIIWHALRTSPGRYWLAYLSFASSVLGCLGVCFSPENLSAESFVLAYQSFLLGTGLIYITVVSSTLADVTLSYLVGFCAMQVLIDTYRFTIGGLKNLPMAFFSLMTFAATSIFAVVLQDSYGPLNKLNCVYSIISGFIIVPMVAVLHERPSSKWRLIVGCVTSLMQLAFCVGAFLVAGKIENIDDTIRKTFFYTTIGMSGVTQFCTLCLLLKNLDPPSVSGQ